MSYEVEVFFDGDCPLCSKEIRMLQRLDKAGRIRFTNIASPDFSAEAVGLSFSELMERIHGRLPDGQLIEGVEVFRRLYAAVGFRRLVAASRWPGVSRLLGLAYRWFAKNRLKLTGRCVNDACQVPSPTPSQRAQA